MHELDEAGAGRLEPPSRATVAAVLGLVGGLVSLLPVLAVLWLILPAPLVVLPVTLVVSAFQVLVAGREALGLGMLTGTGVVAAAVVVPLGLILHGFGAGVAAVVVTPLLLVVAGGCVAVVAAGVPWGEVALRWRARRTASQRAVTGLAAGGSVAVLLVWPLHASDLPDGQVLLLYGARSAVLVLLIATAVLVPVSAAVGPAYGRGLLLGLSWGELAVALPIWLAETARGGPAAPVVLFCAAGVLVTLPIAARGLRRTPTGHR